MPMFVPTECSPAMCTLAQSIREVGTIFKPGFGIAGNLMGGLDFDYLGVSGNSGRNSFKFAY